MTRKEFIEWLPITFGNILPTEKTKEKRVIQGGVFKARDNLPKIVNRLESSVVIDMPLTDVKVALSKILSLERLLPDEALIEFLEQRLDQFRALRAEDMRKAIA